MTSKGPNGNYPEEKREIQGKSGTTFFLKVVYEKEALLQYLNIIQNFQTTGVLWFIKFMQNIADLWLQLQK